MQQLDYRFTLAKKSKVAAAKSFVQQLNEFDQPRPPSAYDLALESAERVHHQIQKQVAAWKLEVEEGNTLFGMVLSEGHPEVVSYKFNESETLPVFTWGPLPDRDPELKAQAMQAEAEASGKTPAQVNLQMQLAAIGSAADFSGAYVEIPTYTPKTYAELSELEKQKLEMQERRLKAEMEASRRAAGILDNIPKLEPRTPDGPKVFPANTTMIFNIRAVSANGRLTSAFDVKVVGHAEFAPTKFLGNTAQIDTLVNNGEIGEWVEQGAGLFKVFEKEAALAAIGKLMQALDGRSLKIRSWYETNHGGVAFNVTDE